MREFIKKLRETNKGSMDILSEREVYELKEFVEHRGYYIVAERNCVTISKDVPDHIILCPLTENDAVKIYKMLNPVTFSHKTPLQNRRRRRR